MPTYCFIFHDIYLHLQAYKAMATSDPAPVSSGISTKSFYGPRARAQRERQHVPVIDPNFDDSDKENDCNDLNIFMQDCCFSFKKKTAINAGPVKN